MPDTAHFERVSVEAGGIRIPQCPRCGAPNVIPRKVERATFGQCAGEECDAWLAYDVSLTVVARDARESAKYHFETHIQNDA
jgi:ribosomal protein S27AE